MTARVAVAAVALGLVAATSACHHKADHPTASIILTADGHPTTKDMAAATAVIRRRLARAHVDGTVSASGNSITVTAPSAEVAVARRLAVGLGRLNLRLVIDRTEGGRSTRGTVVSPAEARSTELKAAQRAFAGVDCSTDPVPARGDDQPGDYVVACDRQQATKYLLAPTNLTGADIVTSNVVVNPQTNAWQVDLSLSRAGAQKWFRLTREAAQLPEIPGCGPPRGCNAIGIELDGVVQDAPRVAAPNGIAGGQIQLGGDFSQAEATHFAGLLKYGALPVHLRLTAEVTQ